MPPPCAAPPLPPAALPITPATPLGGSLAHVDVPVARRPLTVYALAGAGQEGDHTWAADTTDSDLGTQAQALLHLADAVDTRVARAQEGQ